MLIASWNVNGIRSANKEIENFLNKYSPEILGLQEIKSKEIPLNLQKEEYQVIINPAKKAGYSGTATLTKEVPKEVILGIGNKDFDSEGRVITTIFKKFTLVNAYFPNSRRDLSRLQYKIKFDELLEKFTSQFKRVIIMGDFNVAHTEMDLAHPTSNNGHAGFTKEERDWMTHFLNKYVDIWRELHPNEREYTYWSYMFNARKKDIGWRLDYFIISKSLKKYVKECKIFKDVLGSDHAPIGLYINQTF